MENEIFKKLKMLIEALTHSGSDILDKDIFKQIKGICKSSENNVLFAYSLVLEELKKNNSQIRLAAFQICKELFKRSSLFRENVLRDLNSIFDLTTEINSSKKLPPPKSSAKNLECLIISTLKAWVEEFGDTYKKLKVAYAYFEKCKQVDFETLEVGNTAEHILENERQRHLRMLNEAKVRKVLEEFDSNLSEIEGTVMSLSNCMSLLLPPAEEFFIPEHSLEKIYVTNNINNQNTGDSGSNDCSTKTTDENEESENYLWNNKSNLRECGISFDYKLTLDLKIGEEFKIVKTKENSTVIENAKACVKLIKNRFFPMVKKWIKVLSIYGEGNSSNIKKILDLKEKLENILKKYNSLLINEDTFIDNETDSDDEYEFEEVKKEGYEDAVELPEELMLDCLKKTSNARNSMHAVASTSKDSFKEESIVKFCTSANGTGETDSKSSLKSISPILDRKKKQWNMPLKLPYDFDFFCGKDENLSTPNLIYAGTNTDNKSWEGASDLHKFPILGGMPNLRTEVIGLKVPKKRRKTRKSEKNLTHKKMKTSAAALKILESKNLPGLVDVVKRQNNAYARLSKKLFNRSHRRK